jgi:hypothetical protein
MLKMRKNVAVVENIAEPTIVGTVLAFSLSHNTYLRLIFLFLQKIYPGFGPFRSGGSALTGENPGIASEIPKISSEIFILTSEIPKISEEIFIVTSEIHKISEEIFTVTSEIPKISDEIFIVTSEIPKIS